MDSTLTAHACSQCGIDAPRDPAQLQGWMHGRLALSGDFPEVIDSLLLCPGCVEEDHEHDYDEGAGD